MDTNMGTDMDTDMDTDTDKDDDKDKLMLILLKIKIAESVTFIDSINFENQRQLKISER